MRKRTTKGRCEKRMAKKCIGTCKTYSPIQTAYVAVLESNSSIKEFRTNIVLEGDVADYTTDFVCVSIDGNIIVRECISRNMLLRTSVCELLEKSRKYWLAKGVKDWGLVIDAGK